VYLVVVLLLVCVKRQGGRQITSLTKAAIQNLNRETVDPAPACTHETAAAGGKEKGQIASGALLTLVCVRTPLATRRPPLLLPAGDRRKCANIA
jgi:hypothetical protein